MFRIFVGTIIMCVIAMNTMRYFSLEKWVVSLCLLILAVLLYLTNNFIIQYYIKKRAPSFANDEMWQLTAGIGVVPKWASTLGLLAISCFLAALLPWIVSFIGILFNRHLFTLLYLTGISKL
jgi:hypothetical protein